MGQKWYEQTSCQLENYLLGGHSHTEGRNCQLLFHCLVVCFFLFGKSICSGYPQYSDAMKIKGDFLILFSCQIQLDILKLLTCFEGLENISEFFEGIMQEANQYVFLIYPAE